MGVDSIHVIADRGYESRPGKELFKRTTRAEGATDYYSREACRTYPNRCTQSKGTKAVRFGPDTVYVPVIMYGSSRYAL